MDWSHLTKTGILYGKRFRQSLKPMFSQDWSNVLFRDVRHGLVLGFLSRGLSNRVLNMTNHQKLTEKQQKDALIMLILLIVAGFGACSMFKGESRSESKDDCFERVGQEMARREGSKVVTQADIERYYSELTSRCR